MKSWHLEIRSGATGRTVCSVDAEAARVGDIEAVKSGDTLGILVSGDTVAVGYPTTVEAADGSYEMLRWPSGEETGQAIATPI